MMRARPNLNRFLLPRRFFVLLTVFSLLGLAVRAADVVWDGGTAGTGTGWRTVANWSGDVIPGNGDNAIIDSVGTVTTLGVDMNGANSLQQVGMITLGPGRASNLTIRNSSTTTNGVLQLNSVGGVLLSNATALTLAFTDGTSQAMGLGLAASGDIYVNGTQQGVGGIISISSVMSDVGGSRSINKIGGGTLYLRATNTYSGNTTNVEGSLQVDATGTFGNGSGTLYLKGGDIVCAADRSGGAALANPVVMSANCFVINNAGTAGTSRTIPFSGAWSGSVGTLTIANNTAALNNTFQMRMSGSFNFGRDIVIGSATSGSFALLQLYNSATNGDQTFSGNISSAFNAGSGSVWRSGAAGSPLGVTTFTGNNTYDGGTRISYGSLYANNTSGSALGSGTVSVTNSGILGGNGTIVAPVTVSLAGTVTPGATASNVANLNISDLTLGENGFYVVQVTNAAGTAGVGYDKITVSGTWTDAATSTNPFTIKLDSLGSAPANWVSGTARDWTIIDGGAASGFDVSHFAIDTTSFLGTIQGVFSLSVISGDLHLTYTPAADLVINVSSGTINQGQTTPTPYPILTGTFGVLKVGNGEVVLTNALNDYVGSTKVYAGTASLAVDALNGSGAFGAAATSVLLGNTAGNSNATININSAGVTMSRNITVQSGSTGAKTIGTTIGSGVAAYTGDILLQDNATIAAASGGEATFSGLITGSGGVIKTGAGTLSVTALNSYTGDTTLSNGPVIINGRLGTGTLNVAGATSFDSTGANAATLNNTQVVFNANVIFIGTTNLSFGSGPVVLNSSRTFAVSNNTLTVGGTISGAGSLTKNGLGTLALSATTASSYAGNTTLSEGLTTIGASTTFGSGTLNLAGGSLGLTGTRNTTTGLLPNAINMTADTVIQNTTTAAAGTRNLPFGGPVTATAGTLTIRNIATTSVTNVMHVRLHAGGLVFNRPVVFDNSLAGSAVNNTSQLGFYGTNGTGDQVMNGLISGPGSVFRGGLTSGGGGTVILTAQNTHTLGTIVDNGVLGLGANSISSGGAVISGPAGTGTLQFNNEAVVGVLAHGGARVVENFVFLNGTTNLLVLGTNALTLSGPMNIGGVAKMFTVSNTALTTFSGELTNSAALTKAGPGTLVFSANNSSRTNTTAVTEGRLLVNNTSGSGTGSGDVTVDAPGILGGTGSIAGAVSGTGSISPGNSAGTLTIGGGLNLNSGGTYVWELAANSVSNPGVNYDVLSVTGGSLALGGTANLQINFTGTATAPDATNSFWQSAHSWTIVGLSGAAINPGSSKFTSIVNGSFSGGSFTNYADVSGNIILQFNPGSAAPPQPTLSPNIVGAGTSSSTISWSSTAGYTYTVQYKTNLNQVGWLTLGTAAATGSTTSIVDNSGPHAERYYRIVWP